MKDYYNQFNLSTVKSLSACFPENRESACSYEKTAGCSKSELAMHGGKGLIKQTASVRPHETTTNKTDR